MKRQKSKPSTSDLSRSKHLARKHDREVDQHKSLLENPSYLLEGFVKKHCYIIGVLDDIPTANQLISRHYLLSKLDKSRNDGHLPWHLDTSHQVSLNVSAYNIRVIQQSQDFPTIYRIPIHDVASVSYVRDDDDHLLFIKAGKASQHVCPVYVFLCYTKADAEGICSVLQQAFDLVYTEATMLHLKESINVGANHQGRESGTTRDAIRGMSGTHLPEQSSQHYLSQAEQRLTNLSLLESSQQRSPTHPQNYSPSLAVVDSSGDTHQAEQLVIQYMDRLHKQLKFEELQRFAALLKSYREGTSVQQFCQQLKSLYGKKREFLLPDMRSFIPEDDSAAFEAFLVECNLKSGDHSQSATNVSVTSVDSTGHPAPPLSGLATSPSTVPPAPPLQPAMPGGPLIPPPPPPPVIPTHPHPVQPKAGTPPPAPPPPPPLPPPPVIAPSAPPVPSPPTPNQAAPTGQAVRSPRRERNRNQSKPKKEISDSLDHYLEDIDNTMDDLLELSNI